MGRQTRNAGNLLLGILLAPLAIKGQGSGRPPCMHRQIIPVGIRFV